MATAKKPRSAKPKGLPFNSLQGKIVLNGYPEVQARRYSGVHTDMDGALRDRTHLATAQISLLDLDELGRRIRDSDLMTHPSIFTRSSCRRHQRTKWNYSGPLIERRCERRTLSFKRNLTTWHRSSAPS